MNTEIEQRKAHLKKEIEIAKMLLQKNVRNTSIRSYLTPSLLTDLPAGALKLLDDPNNVIRKMDMGTRLLMKDENIIRVFFKYLNLASKALRILNV